MEGHPTAEVGRTPGNFEDHQNQAKPKKLSQKRGTLGKLMAKCKVVTWTVS